MILFRVLAGAAVLSLLAACGTSGATSQGGADEAAMYRELASCLRENGVPNFPDPVQDSDGRWGLPAGTSMPPQEAQNACRSVIDQVQQQTEGQPVSADTIAALRKFATCMRENGIQDWPDPDTDGKFSLPPRLAGEGKNSLFDPQVQKCRPHLPPTGLNMTAAQ